MGSEKAALRVEYLAFKNGRDREPDRKEAQEERYMASAQELNEMLGTICKGKLPTEFRGAVMDLTLSILETGGLIGSEHSSQIYDSIVYVRRVLIALDMLDAASSGSRGTISFEAALAQLTIAKDALNEAISDVDPFAAQMRDITIGKFDKVGTMASQIVAEMVEGKQGTA